MKRAHIKALEAVFCHEVNLALSQPSIRLPYQSKAKVYRELEALGMVERSEVTLPGRPCPLVIGGWALSFAGHHAYCQSCAGEPEAA